MYNSVTNLDILYNPTSDRLRCPEASFQIALVTMH